MQFKYIILFGLGQLIVVIVPCVGVWPVSHVIWALMQRTHIRYERSSCRTA